MDEKKVSNVQSLVAALAPKIKEQDEAHGRKANFNIFYSTGIWHKEIYMMSGSIAFFQNFNSTYSVSL